MTPDRWAEVERLYHAALTRSTEERAAFLAEACGADPVLRREVESLLAQPASGGFLAAPAVALAAELESPPGASVLTGRRLGVYQLQALLGAGGMGEVYRAHDTKLGRDVAIKILPRVFTNDPERLARFEREARMLAALNHPHIGAIYGIEEAEGVRALVLELVEGETLADRLQRGPVPVAEALSIAQQIAEALDAAHEKGIIHRDLKPANIKVTPDGVVKVLDFGLAKAAAGDGSTPNLTHSPTVTVGGTRDGVILGTAAYMSPEQARGLVVDKRTDIWAFGCLLYEMLAGQTVFSGATISDTIAAILQREPDWTALPPSMPPSVASILKRCLEKDARRRLRDIGDMSLLLDLPAIAPAPATTQRASAAGWWLAGTAALGLIGLGAASIMRTSTAAPASPLAKAHFTRFTDFEGSETDAAISRDGKWVAFRSDRDGPVDTWVSQVGTGRFLNLTRGAQNSVLIRNEGFTPDGSEVWLAAIIGGTRLRLVPLTGGSPHTFLTEHAINPAWSPDGSRIVFHTYDTGDPMLVGDAAGTDLREIFKIGPGGHNHFPTWSFEGQWIYFVSGMWDAKEMDIWRIRPSGEGAERLTFLDRDIRYLAPLDERTILYTAPDENGAGPWLWALDTETRASRRVSSGLESYTSVETAADGRRLVATVSNPTANLWTMPLTGRPVTEADVKPLNLPSVRAWGPRYAGSALFYLSSRGSGDGLWKYADGQATEIWKGTDGALFEPPAVSFDGLRVAVIVRKQGRRGLLTLSADGGDVRALAPTLDVSSTPGWSPDGRWIVAAGSERQGPGLFKIPVDGGTPVRLAQGPASSPVWSPDGSIIVYTGPVVGITGQLQAIRPDGSAVPVPAIPVRVGGERYRFVPGREQLVYMFGSQAAREGFQLYDFATKETRELTTFENRATRTFDVTPDGTQIVFDRLRENSDIVLIDLPQPAD